MLQSYFITKIIIQTYTYRRHSSCLRFMHAVFIRHLFITLKFNSKSDFIFVLPIQQRLFVLFFRKQMFALTSRNIFQFQSLSSSNTGKVKNYSCFDLMSQSCTVSKCNRTSRGVCDCCNQNLCLQHLSEHNALLVTQLNPLTDEINELGDRLKSLNIEQALVSCRRKLEQWRGDCHQKIERFFEQKNKELDRLIDEKIKKQQEAIREIQARIAEFIREEETTRQGIELLTSNIQQLTEEMNKIEHTYFDINTRSLVIDDSFVDIKELKKYDISILSPICRTIKRTDGSNRVISNNHRFLLMHKKPNICLVDREMNIVKEVLWNYDELHDMCWSSTINRFILVQDLRIFLLNDETMTIDNVKTIQERYWASCTCSENSLFLVTNHTGASIVKFTLVPTIVFVKEWKSPQTCARDENIHTIKYNDGTLGAVIKNVTDKSLRLELRSVETLDCIWSLGFDTVCNQNIIFRCCSLANDEWLVVDYETRRLLHITRDGKLKTTIPYDGTPYSATIFANILVISRVGGIDFRKL